MTYHGIPATPPRLGEFWFAAKARLDAALAGLLGGAGRVHIVGENYYAGSEQAQWSRVVIVPAEAAWPVRDQPGRMKAAPFVVRAETHFPSTDMRPVLFKLEALHVAIFESLHGWEPDEVAEDFDHLRVRLPVYREAPEQAMPMWDDANDVWWTSAQYRVVAEHP